MKTVNSLRSAGSTRLSLSRTPRACGARKGGIEALEARIAPAVAFGLNASNELIRFDTATPGTVTTIGAITGLQGSDAILGMDFRPADGLLYAIAKDAGNAGHIYTINASTGAATLVSTLAADPADLTLPFTTMNGTDFGVDFNPVPDRLRVVSDTGQNLRINVQTGLVTTDGDLNPGNPDIVGGAYINSFAGATTTTLYTIDSTTDQLFIQNPPNNGTQALVGSLGVNVGTVLGFDVYGSGNTGYLAATVAGTTNFYTVNLATGAATLVGAVGAGATAVKGLAVKGGFSAAASADGNGPFATFTGTADAETLIVTETTDGGLNYLQHNRFAAGDAGFVSALDFDSTVAGEQRLQFIVNGTNARVDVNGGGGADFYSITRNGVFDNGNLNVAGGRILLTNTATTGASLTMFKPTSADFITLVSDTVELANVVGTGATQNVTITGFTAGRPIALQSTDTAAAISLGQVELDRVMGTSFTLGTATSGPISIGDAGVIGNATLNLATSGAVTQTGSLSVGGGTGTLSINAGGAVALGDPAFTNNVGAVGGTAANGHFIYREAGAGALTVNSISNSNGDVVIRNFVGDLTVSGAVASNGGNIVLGTEPGGGGVLTLGANVNAGAGDILLRGRTGVAQTAGIVTADELIVQSIGGSIAMNGANVVSGDVSFAALTGNVAFRNTVAFTIASTANLNAGGTGFGGTTVGIDTQPLGLITLNTSGAVTQGPDANDAINSQRLELISTANATFTLTNPFNDTVDIAANLTGALAYTDIDALNVGIAGALTGITTTDDNVTLTTINGNITLFNVNGSAAPEISAGTGSVLLTAGATAGTDTFINVNADAGILATGGVTLVADNMTISATINAGTATAALRPFEVGTLIDLGGADAAGTLGLTDGELDFLTAGVVVVGGSVAGNLTISAPISPAGTNQLQLSSGAQIVDGNAGTDITVARLGLVSGSGIGTTGSVDVVVTNLEAESNTGGIFVDNAGALIIGGVSAPLRGLRVETSGDIAVTSIGTLTLTDTNGIETVRGGAVGGNVTLTAVGATSDLLSTVDRDSVAAPAGNITLSAGQDILLGTGAPSADNDVRASGGITILAGRDVTIAGFADMASDDFGQNTGGGVTIAAGRTLNVSGANGDDASVSAGGGAGGSVSLTAGPDSFVNITVTFFDAVFSNTGNVTINADRLAIAAQSSVRANAGMITVQPVTPGRLIDLGSVTDAAANTLEISQAELATFSTPLLRIGNGAAGSITVSAPINATDAPTLSLFTAGSITTPVPASITSTNLALHAGTGIGTGGNPLATIVENLAFLNETGLVNIANTGMLTVTEVDDLPASANNGTTTTLSATAGPGPTPGGIVFEVDTFSRGTLTATAVESAQPQDDIRVKFLVNIESETGDIFLTAGDGIIAEENSVLKALDEIKLTFGANDLDAVSFVDLRGFIIGRLLTLQGSAIHETITLANLDNIDVQVINIFTGVGAPDAVNLLDNALSHEINASVRLGGYISILGFQSEVRVFETTTADTLLLAGREGNDTLVAQPGIESVVKIILDGGTGNDVLSGSGTLVGGDGNDLLTGGNGTDTLLGDGGAQFMLGLAVGNTLVRFSPEAPDTILASLAITGLQGGETLVGIDARPADGKIYAVGNLGGTGRIYTIDPQTGAATFVATLAADPADLTAPYTALAGAEFGMDFNPVPDRLRLVSSTGQNLRINVDTGLVTTDGDLNGPVTSIVGSAYLNNFAGTTTTTLYGIDSGTDQLYVQNPPNNGTLVAVGALGLDVDAVLGFEIIPGTNAALASLTVGGLSGLYTVDLFNGVATFVGNFGGGISLRGLTTATGSGNDTLHGGAGTDTLVGGLGNDLLYGGAAADRIEGGDGDDLLDGGDGDDTLNGFTGNDSLTGGAGFDGLNGGLGIDTLIESRDANFTLTNTTLTIGADAPEAILGFEAASLEGGVGNNVLSVGAFTGKLLLNFGDGSDTLDLSGSSTGVTIDLDLTDIPQTFSAGAAAVVLGDAPENFIGTALNDLIYADALTAARSISGGSPSNVPGVPGAPVPPGDKLSVDGQGQFAVVQKSDFNTGFVEIPGFANISFDDIESLALVNSSSTGGFGGTGGANGTGAFSAPTYFSVGKGPESVATGDLNGDGFVDVVTANNVNGTISILLGRGDGTFQLATNIKSGGVQPIEIQLADLDGDLDLDIITSNRASSKVAVMKNDGLANFAPATTFLAGVRPTEFALGDLDGDNDLDLVVVNQTISRLAILLNDGSGSYGTATRIKTGGVGPSDVVVADFNADGRQDIAVVNTSGRMGFFAGNGTGSFTAPPTTFDVGRNPTAIAVADFNNDGNLDVVVNHVVLRFVSVVLGNGSAPGDQFKPQIRIATPTGNAPRAMVVEDFNGDGNADLGLSAAGEGLFRVMLGTGNGLLNPAVSFFTGAPAPRFATSVAIADFNGDGALDVVLTNRSSSDISVLLRNPSV